MGANHQHSSAKCHSEFLLSSRQIRPSNLFVFCLVFLLICLNFVALATPNKMDNKVEKTSAEQQQGVEQHEKHQKTIETTTVAADVEQEEIQTCTVRVQVVSLINYLFTFFASNLGILFVIQIQFDWDLGVKGQLKVPGTVSTKQ